MQYVARPSVPVKEKEKASTGVGSKRNPVRQSHVITSNGHSRDREERQERQDNNGHSEPQQPQSNKQQAHLEKSETVSKATGANTAQGVSKCLS